MKHIYPILSKTDTEWIKLENKNDIPEYSKINEKIGLQIQALKISVIN